MGKNCFIVQMVVNSRQVPNSPTDPASTASTLNSKKTFKLPTIVWDSKTNGVLVLVRISRIFLFPVSLINRKQKTNAHPNTQSTNEVEANKSITRKGLLTPSARCINPKISAEKQNGTGRIYAFVYPWTLLDIKGNLITSKADSVELKHFHRYCPQYSSTCVGMKKFQQTS